jgi:pimeloyl-ACP methyl ester carboxylesterase
MILENLILKLRKFSIRIVRVALVLFILMNIIAIFHAYKFTHFVDSRVEKTKSPNQLSLFSKVKTIVFGVNNPRPENDSKPKQAFETIFINNNKKIECWSIKSAKSKGTVILFHGFGGHKSTLLDKSNEFIKLGYNTMLVDFMGSGGSEGNQTTIGYFESEQVKSCYEYLVNKGEKNIILFGTSMGAVAILKAIHQYDIAPSSIIIECPYGTMYQTVCARFHSMNIPTFPMAGLLTFWGGAVNGFWAFDHNPSYYAKSVKCPTLILYGELDEKVSIEETNEIFTNLNGNKVLKIYPKAGHENYLIQYHTEWANDITTFLLKYSAAKL